ncbi:tyrosine-type recombinase/integrase [Alkalibacter saccharofermentans]|uniref:Site-specific recombinase XerD n=1 Tax=Alkalibacter saccharofermentans DSM 14828 TaxID=1120975 RepID=A0A1M4SD58_9FIRM|nr:tyrosine-type recombinase/integrase [Alkalibacter saccharofermentans]SHE30108.1 Site-specific recombinase XerD [Alkalibacter saccharofermentans DSM 14828]
MQKSEELLDSYATHLKEIMQLSEKTIKAYIYDLRKFFVFLINRSDVDSVDFDSGDMTSLLKKVQTQDIYAFAYHVKHVENKRDVTSNRRLTSLRSFFDYLGYVNLIDKKNPVESVERYKTVSAAPNYLNEETLNKLFDKIRYRNKYRDIAILILISNCALKASEISEIKISDYNGSILITPKKTIKLNDDCKRAIDDYINTERYKTGSEYLFSSQKNDKISVRTIQHIIKNLRVDSELKDNVTSKSIRNTSILRLIESNIKPEEIHKYLGYKKSLSLEKHFKRDISDDPVYLDLDKIKKK